MSRETDTLTSRPIPPRGAELQDKLAGSSSEPVTKTIGTVGCLIVNADDWGQDQNTTNKILDCAIRGVVSSTSAMVFMEDSERAATLAQENRIETGLHLNLVTPFSATNASTDLRKHLGKLSSFLFNNRFSQVFFHPGLVGSFDYAVKAQMDEFRRLYGSDPEKIDGHHHMHLCANVLLQGLLKPGTMVRRSFSFDRSEKSFANRMYRNVVDRSLARRHRLTDYFFSLPPLEPASRLQRIFSLARQSVVEVETHPVNPVEYQYLASGAILEQIGDVRIGSLSAVRRDATQRGSRS